MSDHKKHKSGSKGSQKSFASKRTMNPTTSGPPMADTGSNQGFQQQDVQRRLGNFESEGEHSRIENPGQPKNGRPQK